MTETMYRRSAEALHAKVGEDIVALHVRNGRCFGMEKVTADIWRHIEQPATLAQICDGMLGEYEVDADTCRTDVSEILETMHREGLVVTDTSPGNGC